MDRKNIKMIAQKLGLKMFNLPYDTKDDIFFINGYSVYHSNKDYWIIKGKFPFKILNEISKKSQEFDIKCNHNFFDIKNTTNLTHDKLENFIHTYITVEDIDIKHFSEKCEEIQKECILNDLNNCYIKSFKIYTEKGLSYIVKLIKDSDIHTEWFK